MMGTTLIPAPHSSSKTRLGKKSGDRSTRVAAIKKTRALICDSKKQRVIKVNQRCKNLIWEITNGYRYPDGKHGADDAPADGNDHACFVAGTKISTARGRVPIEDVICGDYVLTRDGYNPVIQSGITSPSASIWQVDFSDGRSLLGTANHPIYVQGKGYSVLEALQTRDIIVTEEQVLYITGDGLCKRENENTSLSQLSLTGLSSGVIRALKTGQMLITFAHILGISRMVYRHCIEKFGNQFMEKYRMGITSTIKTGIQAIMKSLTWSAYQVSNIYRSMMAKSALRNGWRNSESTYPLFSRIPTNGESRTKGDCRQEKVLTQCGKKLWLKVSNVLFAALSLNPFSQAGQSIARQRVHPEQKTLCRHHGKKEYAPVAERNIGTENMSQASIAPVSVLRCFDTGERLPVYNLSVVDAHEYFANGVLVHNCEALESWVWLRV